MKSSRFVSWSMAASLCLVTLFVAAGCIRATSETLTNAGAAELAPGSTSVVSTASSSNSTASTNAAAAAALSPSAGTNAPAKDIAEAEIKGVVETETAVPPTVRSAGAAGELLRMASSGVEDQVLMAYITNSPSQFNLTADEIIYLKDLGISGDVVASALHRDQALKGTEIPATAQAAAPGAAVVDPSYGAPTTNWIGADQAQQPDASQVAPQIVAPASGEGAPTTSAAPVPAPAPQVEVSYSNFYTSLAPYGTWVELDGYGRVWQPTVVVVNNAWQPYFHGGRWIYTDAGWYWSSDYSWGWAPFHYGRWFRHYRLGWCWTPDLVWGPSWVTWRYNDAYCGWAPLPPAACYRPGFGFTYYGSSVGYGFGFGLGYSSYAFINWSHFHHRDHHYRYNHLHAVPSHRARDVYNNTTVVTKIVGNNNTVINEGISAQRVEAATRTRVERVNLRETRSPEVVRSGRPERMDAANKTLTVYKPQTSREARVGGIPMERLRTSGGSAIAARSEAGSIERVGTSRLAGGARSGSVATAPATATTATRVRSTTADTTESVGTVRPVTSTDVDSRGRIARPARTQAANASAPAAGSPQARSASAERLQNRTAPRSPTAGAAAAPQTTQPRSIERPESRSATAAAAGPAQQQLPLVRPSAPQNGANRGEVKNNVTPSRPARIERSAGATQPPVTAPPQVRSSAPRPTAPAVTPTAPAPAPTAPAVRPTAPVRSGNQAQSQMQNQNQSQNQGQRSFWSSPRASQTPSASAVAPAAPQNSVAANPAARQPSAWASPRVYETPSRVERSYTAPTAPAPAPRQYSAPAAAPAPRQYSAPQVQQREFSAPQAQPRQFTAPQMPRREYSAPQQQYSAPQRQFSAPQPSQPQQFSAPAPSPRSYSAPAPSYSAPSGGRGYSAPAASSDRPSRSEGGGGGRSRGER